MHTDQPDVPHPAAGQHHTVTIEGLASGGDGIARLDGFTIFVPHTAPGDVVDIILTQVAKNYGRGQLLSVQTPSPQRVTPRCPQAGSCPGCQLQHLAYPAQLDAKRTFVQDGLERIGHLRGIAVLPTLGMEDPWQYRNKGEFIAHREDDGAIRLGYHGEDHTFIPVTDCPIQHPISMRILHAMEELATKHQLPLAQLITRVSPAEGTALAILVCWEWSDELLPAATALCEQIPECVGVLLSRVRGRSVVRRTLAEPLTGRGKLVQHLGPWTYQVSAESFFQINNVQATHLLKLAQQYAGDLTGRVLADAYCGVGTFLVPLAQQAARAIGIEEHPIALQDASDNLSPYTRHDIRLYEGRVEVMLPRLLRKGRNIDVIILDPPRKGAGREVLEALDDLGVERVVLVSCDPATLGRDAGDLAAMGYRLQSVQPVDMFPQTWHVETIALAMRE